MTKRPVADHIEAQNTEVHSSKAKKPYQKPDFITSRAFERQALSCAGCLNQSAAFPSFCAMRS